MPTKRTNGGAVFTFAASAITSAWLLFVTCILLIALTVPLFKAAFDKSITTLEYPTLLILLFDLASYPTYTYVAAIALVTAIAYFAIVLARTLPGTTATFAVILNCFLVLFIYGSSYAGSKSVEHAFRLSEFFHLYSIDNVSPEEIPEYRNSLHAADRNGNSLVAISILNRKDIALTRALIENDAWLAGQPNHEGATPLILAVRTEANLDVIGLLLESSYADVYQQDNSGRNALDYASESGNSKILTLLHEH